jgi:hypothetical protein
VLHINAANWLFIEQVDFLIDGEKVVYTAVNPNRYVIRGMEVHEWMSLVVDLDFMEKLGDADEVQLLLYGGRIVEGFIRPNHLEEIKQFTLYVREKEAGA